jgi:alpha-tubulin suppressor-like RCC1 family protein/DNA-binding beta-propeller fold protein YncE
VRTQRWDFEERRSRALAGAGLGALRLLAMIAAMALAASAAPAHAASAGQLYAFGANGDGELGDEVNLGTGNANPSPAPVSLPGQEGAVAQAATGAGFSLAVTSGGQLYAFGEDEYGELGYRPKNGESADGRMPQSVPLAGEVGHVIQAAAGQKFGLAVTSGGQLYAFGDNYFGQLGDGADNLLDKPHPTPTLVTLPGASGPVTQVAAGAFHSLAVTAAGRLDAFGENEYGQLGDTTDNLTYAPNPQPTLVTLPGEVGPVIQAAAGHDHSLALTSTGQLYAFGYDEQGQLGAPPGEERQVTPNPTPTLVRLPGASGHVIRIAAGDSYSLALTSTGQLYAFGEDYSGQLGAPPGEKRATPHPTPTPVPLPANAETMATGSWSNQTLVVLADLSVSSASLPGGEAGVPYSASGQSTGGAPPYDWSARGLPPGLSIDPATGAISGTPAAGGSYTPTITVTDSYGIEASAPLTIAIQPLSTAPGESAPLAALSASSPLSARLPSAPRTAPTSARPRSAADAASRSARASRPRPRTGSFSYSPSSWVVHKYRGQITEAEGAPLDKPVGLAFDANGDLLVSDADEESGGYVYRYGPTDELECTVGGGFPFGDVPSVSVNDATGEVYVADSFLFEASIWFLTPEGRCYRKPTAVDYEDIVSLTVNNGPGSRRGDLYAIASEPPYGSPVPRDIETNGRETLEGPGTELPEPLDEFSEGGESESAGMAIDPAGGTIYVANPQSGEVDVYDNEDELQPRTLTTGEAFRPIAVGVDPTNGEVYVVDTARKVVDEFDANGELIGEITGEHTPAGKLIEPRNVAVKPSTHEVYVSDEGAHAVDIFGADEEAGPAPTPASEAASEVGVEGATLNGAVERKEGEPLSWFFRYARGASCTGGERTEREQIAGGEEGLLHEHAKLEGLEPASEYSVCFSDEGAEGVLGMDAPVHFETGGRAPADGAVSVSEITPSAATVGGSLNPENQLTRYWFEYSQTPAFEAASVVGERSFAKGVYPSAFVAPAGLARLAPATAYYVRLVAENATGRYTSPAVSFTTRLAAAPAVEYWGASEGETTLQARLEGYVNPNAQSTTCMFQYTPEAQYALEGFTGAGEVPCVPASVDSDAPGVSEVVSADADGLQAGVTYYYRLIAENETGAAVGPVSPATASYTTMGPPSPSTGGAEGLSQHAASLGGEVNPDRLRTSYRFEYASEVAYTTAEAEGKQNPYVDGRSTTEAAAGSGDEREPVPLTPVTELQAGTTYHYRLVATNDAGTRYGQDRTLTTEAEHTTSTSKETPPPPPPPPPGGHTSSPPVLGHAGQTSARWREGNRLAHVSRARTATGTTFSFTLSEQASVSFSFIEILGRAPLAGSCLAQIRQGVLRHGCHAAARGTLAFTAHSGADRVVFAGRISRTHRLRPGRYELVITATNSAGQNSQPTSLRFTILP